MDGAPGDHQRKSRHSGFSSWLRGRSDDELAVLLSARPDLLAPVPADSGVLASRAVGRRSLERALDGLDRFALQVSGALASATTPVTTAGLGEALRVPREPLQRCIDTLCARALAWSDDGTLRPAPGLSTAIGEAPGPGGADRAMPEPPPLDIKQNGPGMVDQTAAGAAMETVRGVADLLGRWAAGPPPVLRAGGVGIRQLRRTATVLDVPVPVAALYAETARAAGLLAASGWADGDWLPTGRYDAWRESGPAEQWAALAAAWLSMTRVPALTGQRDDRGRLLNALGGGLDRMEAPAVRAAVLRQLAGARGSVEPRSLLRRLAWLLPRRQGPVFTLLVEATLREAAMLGVTGLGALPAHGRALTAPAAAGAAAPHTAAARAGPAGAARAEPAGAAGSATSPAAAAAAALAELLPEPVDHVLLQADLTAVAPGPLVPELETEFALMATVESTGGATVYRFSAPSVRRALDAGRTGGDLLAFLERSSATPVPQPLRYLVEDLARRHGRVRVGTASAYVRCDDPSVVAEIAADQRTARLRLRRLAPTVLASSSGRDVLLETLRELGYAPAAESDDGTVEVSAPAAHRARTPAGFAAWSGVSRGPRAPAGPGDEMVRTAISELRAGDEAASAVRHQGASFTAVDGHAGPASAGGVAGILADGTDGRADGTDRRAQDRERVLALISALTAAAAARERVWVGYVDSTGVARSRILKPERVEGGYVTAYDAARAVVRRLALHRITGVALLEPAPEEHPPATPEHAPPPANHAPAPEEHAPATPEHAPATPPLNDPGGAR
jgi:Helicase conserved C-terminal domain